MPGGPGAKRAPTGYNDVARDHENQIDCSLPKGELDRLLWIKPAAAPQLEWGGMAPHDSLMKRRSARG